jgi:predicted TIM-barrel fold metal-dependent hydrolase
MGKRRIIDAHHHLWDLQTCQYPWLMARGVTRFFGDPTPIQKNYVVADFREDAADYEPSGREFESLRARQLFEVRSSS